MIVVIVVLAFLILILAVALMFIGNDKPAVISNDVPVAPIVTEEAEITVTAPEKNAVVASPMHIEGVVDGGGWNGFEGQVGTVHLLDSAGNELAVGVLTATTDWMLPPVSFATDLEFTPKGSTGVLLFKNENPSGDPEKDKSYAILVNFK